MEQNRGVWLKLWTVPMDAEGVDGVHDDDRQPLEEHRPFGRVVEILDAQHAGVEELGREAQRPLEPGEERRVVERPRRGAVHIPFLHRQVVRHGQPVAVHLEVGGATGKHQEKSHHLSCGHENIVPCTCSSIYNSIIMLHMNTNMCKLL